MLTTRSKITLARMIQAPILSLRHLFGLGAEFTTQRRGINWALDIQEGIDFSIFLLGAFEPSTVSAYEKYVQPGMAVLDIGANVGAHTLHLARLVGDSGRVLACEPTDWAVAKLRANIAKNPGFENRIDVRQVLLSDGADEILPENIHASWPLSPDGDVHPTLRARAMTTCGAKTSTLDALLAESNFDRIDFIKMDVDGYECQVLGGMTKTLKTFTPPIFMEFSPYGLEEKGGSLKQMMAALHKADYDLFRLTGGPALPRELSKLQGLVKDGAGINVIAKPN